MTYKSELRKLIRELCRANIQFAKKVRLLGKKYKMDRK